MDSDRTKWNDRYASEESFLGRTPSPFLSREIERIKQLLRGRRALDVACGEGRNSIFLAANGFRVTAIDISEVGIAKGMQRAETEGVIVEFLCADLDEYRLHGSFDLVLNFNYLQRSLIPLEVDLLTPGGLLLFDTILALPQNPPSRNHSFYLQPGELAGLFGVYDGEILCHEESLEGTVPTARLMFRKAGRQENGGASTLPR